MLQWSHQTTTQAALVLSLSLSVLCRFACHALLAVDFVLVQAHGDVGHLWLLLAGIVAGLSARGASGPPPDDCPLQTNY